MSESSISKDLTPREFERFRDFIHEHSGIFLEESKSDSLRISLISRATRHQFANLEEYFRLLSEDDEEFKELLNLVTINETSFLRFPAQFDGLRDRVIPEIMEGKAHGKKELRFWCAGCSTGEEPYSVAMTVVDSGMQGLGWEPSVLGTDVSTKALRVARNAVYSGRTLLNLSDDVLRRHFEKTREGHRVAAHVRRLCDFGYHNLIKEPYPLALMGNWDVIFCRNVTIYFKMESTQRVVANFFNSLNPGGYLFIGHSETLSSSSDRFEACEVGGVFLYRKPAPTRLWAVQRELDPETRKEERVRAVRAERASAEAEERVKRERAGRRERLEAKEREAAHETQETSKATGDVETLLAEARELSKSGEPARVLEKIGAVLAADPNNGEAYVLAAYAHADSGDYDAALGECHKAIAIDPLEPSTRYILGMIHQRQNDLVRAISEFRKAIYIDPEFALAHLNLGNIYRSQGKMDSACREYENAMRGLKGEQDAAWKRFLGGFDPSLLVQTCERSLLECRKATRTG